MATVSYPHIAIDADGTALVEGTRTKVVEIASIDWLITGMPRRFNGSTPT